MKLAAASLGLLLVASTAHADRRSFTRTYEYMTMPEGETELQLYSTQSRTTLDGASPKDFELQLEVEHGITDHWDVSLYQVFTQVDGVSPAEDVAFGFRELRLRTRYRFSERGELPVDLTAFAEAAKTFGESRYQGEGRLILAREFGKLVVAANGIGIVDFGPALDEPEIFVGYAAGLGYEILPEIQLGAESWGEYDLETEDDVEPLEAYAGPVVSWAPATNLWATVGAGLGLTDAADDLTVRLLLGLHL